MFENNRKEKWLFLAILFILALIGFLVFLGLNAQASSKDKKFINIQEVVTKTGIKIWLVEDHSLPVIALSFAFKNSGTALDPIEKQGLARLLSNTMDEGAEDLDSNAFQKKLSGHSISLQFNASRDNFGGNLITLTRNKDVAFDLLKKAIKAPRFDVEPVARMRDANIARVKSSLSEPDWIAARLINDVGFGNHPYAKNSGGTISSLSSITPEDLKQLRMNNLSQNDLVVAVSGDITADEVIEKIDGIFSTLTKTIKNNSIKDATITNSSKIFLYKKDIPQTFIEIILPTFDNKDPDYYALQVLNYIYGGAGFGSRLMENAREKNGLTYGIYSNILDFDHADALSISTSTKNESVKQMLEIIHAEMIKLQTTPITEQELNNAKSYIVGSMPLALKSTKDLADIALSLQAKDKPIDYLDNFSDKINAVTIDDIQRVAKKILTPENSVTVLVGKPIDIQNTTIIERLPNVE